MEVGYPDTAPFKAMVQPVYDALKAQVGADAYATFMGYLDKAK
jgi:hypothetical protein